MRGSSFAGSLLFALIAALASIPWMMTVGPLAGSPWATAGYSLGAAVGYLVWIAPSWRRGLTVGALATVPAAAVLVLATPSTAVMGAAVILAVARSGFLFAGKPVRALVVEGALAGGGLVFAAALAGPSPASLAWAVWGFFLVQSVFFLIGGLDARPADGPRTDPFAEARRRALELMEQPPEAC